MSNKPRLELRRVTPEWAADILRKHDESITALKYRQRPINTKVVENYATDMKAGNWGVTGQGISFDENGNLMDGQHRLSAIVKAGVTMDMVVLWGVPQRVSDQIKSIDVIDIGRKRNVGQQLRIDGFQYYMEIATTARCLLMLCNGNKRRDTSQPQTISVANLMRNNISKIIQILSAEGRSKQKLRGYILAPLVLFGTADPDTAELFATEFVEMTGLSKTSPVLQFIRFLERPTTIKGGTDYSLMAMSVLSSALYSYANGKRVEAALRGNEEHVEWLLRSCKNTVIKIRTVSGMTLTMEELKSKG